jgi:hypothetical protein
MCGYMKYDAKSLILLEASRRIELLYTDLQSRVKINEYKGLGVQNTP